MLAVLGTLVLAQSSLPKVPQDILGTYTAWTGFAVTSYVFKPGGKLVIRQNHDHPGRQNWTGAWTFEHGKIEITIAVRQRGKVLSDYWEAIPVSWGDRLMLVDVEDLQAGRVAAMFRKVGSQTPGGRKFGSQKTDLPFATRAEADIHSLPKLYGTPKAPEPYDRLLAGITTK